MISSGLRFDNWALTDDHLTITVSNLGTKVYTVFFKVRLHLPERQQWWTPPLDPVYRISVGPNLAKSTQIPIAIPSPASQV
jgi:hypothetical protein